MLELESERVNEYMALTHSFLCSLPGSCQIPSNKHTAHSPTAHSAHMCCKERKQDLVILQYHKSSARGSVYTLVYLFSRHFMQKSLNQCGGIWSCENLTLPGTLHTDILVQCSMQNNPDCWNTVKYLCTVCFSALVRCLAIFRQTVG